MDPVLQISVSVFLAGLMVIAGLHKLRSPLYFGFVIDDYKLLPDSAGRLIVIPLGVLEVVAGIALCIPDSQSWGALLVAFVLSIYLVAIAINLLRNRRDIDCGCHGPFQQQPLSYWLLARNAGLVILALLVSIGASGRVLGWLDWWVSLCVLTCLSLLYITFEMLLRNSDGAQLVARNP